jgi:hypothetical protein
MKSFLRSFALYLSLLWHIQKFQFLAKLMATSIAKLLDNNVVDELCSGELNVAYCRDLEWKLPTPPPPTTKNDLKKNLKHSVKLFTEPQN